MRILCAQIHALKLSGQHFIIQQDNNPEHKATATRVERWNILALLSQSSNFSPTEQHSSGEDKTKSRETHYKQKLKVAAVKLWESITCGDKM